jgi:hypothetical protein
MHSSRRAITKSTARGASTRSTGVACLVSLVGDMIWSKISGSTEAAAAQAVVAVTEAVLVVQLLRLAAVCSNELRSSCSHGN